MEQLYVCLNNVKRDIFSASIKRKNGSFCPEKCQKNSNCRTDNLVCRTCQDGWEGPYCYRKIYCHCFFLNVLRIMFYAFN